MFFDFSDILHHEFLPRGHTINTKYYVQGQRRLREVIEKNRPDLLKTMNNNAPVHTSLLVRNFFARHGSV